MAIYLKRFTSLTDANTQGETGLQSPHVDIIDGFAKSNWHKASTDEFTCEFDDEGRIVLPATGNKIYYTTSDGSALTLNYTSSTYFGANVVSNTYDATTGGCITFDGDVTEIRGDYDEEEEEEVSPFGYTLQTITIPNSVTSIGQYAFNDRYLLNSITIPSGVTSIGEDAFEYCSALTSITIPNSVTGIGYGAFYYCYSLNGITIPDSVTSIGDWAFGDCYTLSSVIIGNGVTSIGEAAFSYCSSIRCVIMGSGVTSIGERAFEYCSKLYDLLCKATTPPSLDSSAFSNVPSTMAIYVPSASVSAYKAATNWKSRTNYIEAIPSSTMQICYKSTDGDVVTPNASGVEIFGANIVSNTYDATTGGCITFDNAITSIGKKAFASCTTLSSITIPTYVITIGDYAFDNCTAIVDMTIPSYVNSIGIYAFKNCTSLIGFSSYPSTPPILGDGAFENVVYYMSINVWSSCVDDYKAAPNWSERADYISDFPQYN